MKYSGITSIQDALVVSGHDFTANKTNLFSNGIEHTNLKGITTNSGLFLGVAGKNYEVIQNAEYFDFLNPLLKEKEISIDSIKLYDNKTIVKATIGETNLNPAINDIVKHYVYLSNDFSGKSSSKGKFFTLRLACLNGATRSTKDAEFSIRHFSNYQDKLAQAMDLLNKANLYNLKFTHDMHAMINTKVDVGTMVNYINNILSIKNEKDITTAKRNMRKDISDIYNTKDDIKPYKGSVFAGYLAITDYFSHKKVKNETSLIKEMSILNNSYIENAYIKAMELISN
jgi:hypothetical protein